MTKEEIIKIIDNKINNLKIELDKLLNENPKISNYIVELSQINILKELKGDLN